MNNHLEKLIKACQDKDPKAQETLYRQFSGVVMGICVRYAKSRYEADDIFQEVFIKIFENIYQFRQEGSFEGWVRRIAVNQSLKRIQNAKVLNKHDDIGNMPDIHFNECVLEKLATKELVEIIDKLPLGYKTVFNLFVVEGFSHKEIGDILSITEGTSKSQYFHAKKLLKKLLEENNITAHAH